MQAQYRDAASGKIKYQNNTYPINYGGSACRAWDAPEAPYCAHTNGTKKSDAPEWCKDKWCWIDTKHCNLDGDFYGSHYFPKSGLKYSFQTCGGTKLENTAFVNTVTSS